MLIKNGATPIASSRDILDALHINSNSFSQKNRMLEDCTIRKKIYETLAEPMSRTNF